MPVTAAYLDTLNSEQRRAVEHGVAGSDCLSGVPLLVVAGAGSGKTNTLAHRAAHLIVNGADPRRILLMTFSRRLEHHVEQLFIRQWLCLRWIPIAVIIHIKRRVF